MTPERELLRRIRTMEWWGQSWGAIQAWIVHGPRSKDEGIKAAQAITRMNCEIDALLALPATQPAANGVPQVLSGCAVRAAMQGAPQPVQSVHEAVLDAYTKCAMIAVNYDARPSLLKAILAARDALRGRP